MSRIYLCFLWHMHQPCYKDLISGEYKLPWTRMHALKDYYGMVRVLGEFPSVHQTFNVVPSMMSQVEEYASGTAADPFLRCATKPSEELSSEERDFVLQYFFQANPSRMIYRYPRYGALYEDWLSAGRNVKRARHLFGDQALRDLQVLSQLAWFDEEIQATDVEVRDLISKGRDYTLGDQSVMARKQTDILGRVLPVYRDFAAKGQIEISTTPFYHPILPLLCDSDIAGVAHPYVPLPSRFRFREDAEHQLERARAYIRERFGRYPSGLWPSEGSVSDEALGLASECGFLWAATDDGVLARTFGSSPGAAERYRPYLWRQEGRQIHMIFRDHFLSDLIGFVYSRMGAAEAADDFLSRIRENCRPLLSSGRDALVPVILDGENAWEYYDTNGRPFLRELYRRISEEPSMEALTVSEALERMDPAPLDRIFPGSWINANFDIWIGAEEDNQAWEYLLRARKTYERVISEAAGSEISTEQKVLAWEELLIAQGSDWCWWYGPEHDSHNRPEFDQLYRDHLSNVYRSLGLTPPDELSRPILKAPVLEYHSLPAGPIRATIDGEVTSFFEWLGAGVYRVDGRTGAMHGQRHLIRELHYGSDGTSLYLRLDFETLSAEALDGIEARIRLAPESNPTLESLVRLGLRPGGADFVEVGLGGTGESVPAAVEASFHKILEVRLPLAQLGVEMGQGLRFQLSLWRDGLPMGALPPQEWLKCSTADPTDWPV